MLFWRRTLVALVVTAAAFPGQGYGQSAEENKLADAALALQDFRRDSSSAIPPQILQSAQGVVVIPNMIRAGCIFGWRRGRGVAVVRSENGEWSNPMFVTITGGSVGAQIGGESTNVVLVFGNRRSVRNIGSGKFTLGGDVSVTAGPLGRGSRGATDLTFTSEVYSYARGRGLYAGAAFEGAKLDVDHAANQRFYSQAGGTQALAEQSIATPASARRFLLGLEQAESLPGAPVPTMEDFGQQEEAVTYPLGGGTAQ